MSMKDRDFIVTARRVVEKAYATTVVLKFGWFLVCLCVS